jgi:hypothetical protein
MCCEILPARDLFLARGRDNNFRNNRFYACIEDKNRFCQKEKPEPLKNMKTILLLAAVLALTGCNDKNPDGYRAWREKAATHSFTVTVYTATGPQVFRGARMNAINPNPTYWTLPDGGKLDIQKDTYTYKAE